MMAMTEKRIVTQTPRTIAGALSIIHARSKPLRKNAKARKAKMTAQTAATLTRKGIARLAASTDSARPCR